MSMSELFNYDFIPYCVREKYIELIRQKTRILTCDELDCESVQNEINYLVNSINEDLVKNILYYEKTVERYRSLLDATIYTELTVDKFDAPQ